MYTTRYQVGFEIITKEQLIEKLRNAITAKDKETIFKYITKAKNAGVNADLLKEALKVLRSKEEIPEPEPLLEPAPVPLPKSNVNVYLNRRRR